jgi:hypothetical protein
MGDWRLYAAYAPGSLRRWQAGEFLPVGIHDIWRYRPDSPAWQLQIMLQETAGETWFHRRYPQIGGMRREFITRYQGRPCIRVEIQLLYKARSLRERDEIDFQACLPMLSPQARTWLQQSLAKMYPSGHPWINRLAGLSGDQ